MSAIERLRALLDDVPTGVMEHDPHDPHDHWLTRTERLGRGEFGASIIVATHITPEEGPLLADAVNTLPALLDALDELVAMIPEAYCVLGRFETCGDPFCVEARDRRDAILARLDGAS